MPTKGYTVMGWLVWQLASRIVGRKVSKNKVKLGAAATVAAVLVGGVAAGRMARGDD
jgi:hypothetical protein